MKKKNLLGVFFLLTILSLQLPIANKLAIAVETSSSPLNDSIDTINYFSINPQQVIAIKNLSIYSSPDRKNKTEEFILSKTLIEPLELVDDKSSDEFFLKIEENKYISADISNYSIYSNSDYFYEKPELITIKNDVPFFSDNSLDNETGKLALSGESFRVIQLSYTATGIPYFETSRGFLIASRYDIAEITISLDDYLTENPGYVEVKTDVDAFDTVAAISPISKISQGTILKISSIEYSEVGYPFFQTDLGFISSNKKFVQPFSVDLSKYFTTAPKYITLTRDDYIYGDLDFSTKIRATKKDTTYKVLSIDYSEIGYPRIKIAENQYLTANKNYVKEFEVDLSKYYTIAPKYITLTRDDYIYGDLDFSTKIRTTKKDTTYKVLSIEYSEMGYPRIKIAENQYLTANKNYVKEFKVDLSKYYTSTPDYILLKNDEYSYITPEFLSNEKKALHKKNSIIKIIGVGYSDKGYPRLLLENGSYITANKSYVQKLVWNYQNFIMTAPEYVVLLKNDVTYSSAEFSSTTAFANHNAGSVFKVSGISYSNSGIPRLKLSNGQFLTANKAYVSKIISNYTNYYSTNPGHIYVLNGDTSYSSIDFSAHNKKRFYNKGDVLKVLAVEYTSDGYPRLKVGTNEYITANKSYVKKIVSNYSDYYLTAPAKIRLRTNDSYYSSSDFTSKTKGNRLPAGSVISVQKIELSESGHPRIKTRFGYLTANKNYVVATNDPENIFMDTPFYNQVALGAPMGCEGASLLQALHYKGYATNHNLTSILNEMPRSPNGNPYFGFVGSPFVVENWYTAYQAIFPSAFAPWANRYNDGKSKDISGNNVSAIREELLKGNPVVIWVTVDFQNPVISFYSWGSGVANLHVMTATGYSNGQYCITDPYRGRYWVSESTLATAYAPFKMAVSIG